MTRRKPIEISTSERIVMDIVIKHPEGLSFQEIVTLLQDEGKIWHPSTIATFLKRLEKKEYLFHTKKLKQKYRYFSKLSERDYYIMNNLKEEKQRIAKNIKDFSNAFDHQQFNFNELEEILEYVKKLQECVNKRER